MKRNTFILKCFLQFACTNLDGCQKEKVTFKFASERGGTQKGGGLTQKREGKTIYKINKPYKICQNMKFNSPLLPHTFLRQYN